MKTSIGIRLDDEFIEALEELGKEENLDRSTILRKFLEMGYRDYLKKKAAESYMKGELSISGAADTAKITVWEMMNYLVDEGYRSDYSGTDMMEEIELLESL